MTARPLSPLAELAHALRQRWPLALGLYAFLVLAGIAWLAAQPTKHSVTAVLADKKQSLGLPSGALGGLGGAIGILGLGQDQEGVKRLQEVVYSAELANRLEERHKISRRIFDDRWNAETGRWDAPRGVVPRLSLWIKSLFGVSASAEVTAEDVQLFLQDIDFRQSDVSLSAYHVRLLYPDPVEGREILTQILDEADDLLREQQIVQGKARQAYLERRILEVQVAEQRASLARLLSETEMTNLISNADTFFSVEMISQPRASASPTSPRYLIALILIVVGSAALVVLFVWTLSIMKPLAGSAAHRTRAEPDVGH